MLEDLTFELKDFVEVNADSASPASIIDRVLQRLRSAAKGGEGRTQTELNADPLCGGSVTGIKKALQRLRAQGLVTARQEPSEKRAGSSVNRYFAKVSRDMCERECPPMPKSSAGLEKLGGQPQSVSPLISEDLAVEEAGDPAGADLGGHENACPPETPCIDAGFEQGDTFSVTPQGGKRSPSEMEALIQAAKEAWE
jgi:hypothetical protein